MRCLTALVLLAPLAVPAEAQEGVRLGTFRARPEATGVRLEWQMDAEPGVVAFELRRRTETSGGQYVLVASLRPHGPNRPYEFVDGMLYKEMALAEYQLEATFASGVRRVLFTAPVNYTTTGIRRTWGSIKAMFQ